MQGRTDGAARTFYVPWEIDNDELCRSGVVDLSKVPHHQPPQGDGCRRRQDRRGVRGLRPSLDVDAVGVVPGLLVVPDMYERWNAFVVAW